MVGRLTRLRHGLQTGTPKRLQASSQDGFLLMEVMISALLVALIVIATFAGFEVANRSTADERAHAQADSLAQQDEDRLRGMTADQLSNLSETHTATSNGTVFTITSKAKFISDATGTESCSAATASADYIQTTSEVGWPALKSRPKVVETGLVAPHVGGSLLVQVLNASGKGVSGMTVTATGPAPAVGVETAVTGASGCVIFGSVEPGEYQVNAKEAGYVEKDGNSEVPVAQQTASVVNGSTTKKILEFDQGSELAVKFETAGAKSKGEAFLVFNTNMTTPSYRAFGALGVQAETITTPKTLFPFSTSPNYIAYAGSCLADNPETNNASLKPPTVNVPAGGGATVTVTQPPIKLLVMSGTKESSPGSAMKVSGTLIDTGCEKEGIEVKRAIETNSKGELPSPGMPYGSYSLCVTGTTSGKAKKLTTTVKNTETAGVPATVYLGAGKTESGCP
jgi:Tfp pilus assembly protein PilV